MPNAFKKASLLQLVDSRSPWSVVGKNLDLARYPHSTHRGLALKVIRLAFNLLT